MSDQPTAKPALNMEDLGRILSRSRAMLLLVAILSSLGVYLGHDWFHGVFLPALGVNAPLGDALGGLVIILVAYFGQLLVSLAIFRDTQSGLKSFASQLLHSQTMMRGEIEELSQLASTDKLTGCWNRRRLEDTVRGEIGRISRYDQSLCILILDIDHFKSVNDRHGHNVGDQVLRLMAALLRDGLRAPDSLTRWGGEEFIVLCPNTALTTAILLAERLRKRVEESAFEHVGRVTVSIGVAECLSGEDWQHFMERADKALYRAKSFGRNQVQFAPEAPIRVGGSRPAEGLVQLVWHKKYESGLDLIDREHQALFTLANNLLNAIMSDAPAGEIGEIVGLLMKEVEVHFKDEEEALAALGWPGLAEHSEIHRILMDKATRLVGDHAQGRLEAGAVFQFLAYDVVAKHILGADRKYAAHIRSALDRSATES